MNVFFLYILYWASFMNTSARYHPEILKAPCIYSAGFAVSGIVWVNTPWIFYMGSMHLILANRDKGGAVWSGLNMVNCLQNIHNGDLVAHLGKWDIWCLCDFEVWLMFFLCCCYAVYNIVLYCYLFFKQNWQYDVSWQATQVNPLMPHPIYFFWISHWIWTANHWS